MANRNTYPIGRCGVCTKTWTSEKEAHCKECCRHFRSTEAFDRHRKGPISRRVCK